MVQYLRIIRTIHNVFKILCGMQQELNIMGFQPDPACQIEYGCWASDSHIKKSPSDESGEL